MPTPRPKQQLLITIENWKDRQPTHPFVVVLEETVDNATARRKVIYGAKTKAEARKVAAGAEAVRMFLPDYIATAKIIA